MKNAAILTLALMTLGACNTIEGAGRDIAVGGAAVSNTAVETEKAIKKSTY